MSSRRSQLVETANGVLSEPPGADLSRARPVVGSECPLALAAPLSGRRAGPWRASSRGCDAEAAQEAQAAAEDRADRLSGPFTPEATTAIVRLEDQSAESACEHARTATRNRTGLLTATQIVDDAAATATDPQLARLPNRWPDLIDIESTQAEIDRCAAEETAAIEAEQQAATAVEPETPIGYSECLADIPGYPELCLDLDGDGYAGFPDSG